MVVLDRNWRCDEGEIDLVLRDGDVLVVCEVKTRSSLGATAPRTRRSPTPRLARLRRLGAAVGRGARRPPGDIRIDLVGGAAAAARGRPGRPRAGARLMPFATAHTVVAARGARPPDRRPGRRLARARSAPPWSAAPTRRCSEARDRCRMAIVNSGLDWPATKRITILLSPADLPKRGTHFDLAHRGGGAGRRRQPCRPRRAGGHGVHRRAHPRRRAAVGARRAADGAGRGRRAASGAVFVPEPQAREAAMVPGMSVLGVRSLGQVVAELRGERGARGAAGRADVRRPAAGLARRGAARRARPRRPARHGRRQVRRRGGRRRRPRTCCSPGPRAPARPASPSGSPAILPDLTAEESLELTAIHSLAGALEPGRRADHPAAVLARRTTTPARPASSAAAAARCRPGEISRAHCGVLFLDEFPLFRTDIIEALRQPLESGDVTIARGEESVDAPGPRHVRAGVQPVPVRRLHRQRAAATAAPAPRQQRRDYRAKITGPIADRIDITRHVEPVRPHERTTRSPPPRPSAAVRARVAAARGAAGRALRRAAAGGSTARCPARCCASAGRSTDAPSSALDDASSTPAGSAAAARSGCTGSPGPWPTSPGAPGATRPGSTRSTMALRLRTGEPLAARSRGARTAERPDDAPHGRPTGWRGSPLEPARRARRPAARRAGAELGREPAPRPAARARRDLDGVLTDVAARLARARPRARARAGRAARHPLRRPRRRRVAGAARRPRPARAAPASAAGVPLGLWVRGPAAARPARRRRSRWSARASATTYGDDVAGRDRRRRRRRRACRWSPAPPSASTGRPPGRARRPARRPWRCSPAAPTGPTRPPTSELLDHIAEHRRGGLRGAARAARRSGSGSSPATG